ncbi:NAD(P)/FAD-dependent oxidoreductase [Lentisalinibacter sediminis]|uniref:NAD(P)/FAD-dependent oxidoreductase n=2 Tax=Lentisalinibacter sediminis TaxID=2992237 RepID=UPI0038704EAF
MAMRKQRIVIVGAGFAGLAAATAISRRYAVTVVDPSAAFEWTPNIHEILSGTKSRRDVLLDSRALVENAGHRFLEDAVERLDVGARRVHTATGAALEYDACLLAPGGARAHGGIAGAAQHAVDFRHAGDAALIEARLTAIAGRGGASSASVVIIGGGVSGIEALGEILRSHRQQEGLTVHVVECEPELLPGLPAALAADIRARCAGLPVRWHTGEAVSRLTAKTVVLASGERLPADLAIWSAGLTPPPFLAESGLIPGGRAGVNWVPVRDTLQSEASPALFVAGDCAGLPEPLRKQAYHALDMGAYAAWNLQHFLRSRPLKAFRPSHKPLLISLGDLDTYLVAGGTVLASPLLAAAKEGVYQFYMTSLSLGLPAPRLAAGLVSRASNALRKQVLPEAFSCASLARVRGSRIVSAAD